MSRATLLGRAAQLGGPARAAASAAFAASLAHRGGVDAVADTDLYFLVAVERVFFVGGLGSDTRAETVGGDAYRAAAPDPLRALAPSLVRVMNEERREDVARFCEAAGVAGGAACTLLWVDRLGFDARAVTRDGSVTDVRVSFGREVKKEQDAVSALTLLAQQLWEQSADYEPAPVAAPAPAGA